VDEREVAALKKKSRQFFAERLVTADDDCLNWITSHGDCPVREDKGRFSVGKFSAEIEEETMGENEVTPQSSYLFNTESVAKNAFKLLRGLQGRNSSNLAKKKPAKILLNSQNCLSYCPILQKINK
jgi:hypothetical protein